MHVYERQWSRSRIKDEITYLRSLSHNIRRPGLHSHCLWRTREDYRSRYRIPMTQSLTSWAGRDRAIAWIVVWSCRDRSLLSMAGIWFVEREDGYYSWRRKYEWKLISMMILIRETCTQWSILAKLCTLAHLSKAFWKNYLSRENEAGTFLNLVMPRDFRDLRQQKVRPRNSSKRLFYTYLWLYEDKIIDYQVCMQRDLYETMTCDKQPSLR